MRSLVPIPRLLFKKCPVQTIHGLSVHSLQRVYGLKIWDEMNQITITDA